jgi:hypothetical protein
MPPHYQPGTNPGTHAALYVYQARRNRRESRKHGNLEGRQSRKIDVWLGELKGWRKETATSQEATEASLEKAKNNPEKKKTAWKIWRPRWIPWKKCLTK